MFAPVGKQGVSVGEALILVIMIIQHQGQSVRLPDVMMVGAAKSGSTSVYRLLTEHPQVFFPDMQKEPYYFCNEGKYPEQAPEAVRRMVWDTQEFFNLYKDAQDDQVTVDGSTSYLYRHEASIRHMRKLYGERLSEIKIIIILRDPVPRAYSHYTFLKLLGWEKLDFKQALEPEQMDKRASERWSFDYLGFGDYHDQVKAYMDTFPQCLILLTEDLKDTDTLSRTLSDFLDVEDFKPAETVVANPSGVPKSKFLVRTIKKNKALKYMVNLLDDANKNRLLNVRDRFLKKLLRKEPIDPIVEQHLIDYYRPKREALESLIGRDLSHWKS